MIALGIVLAHLTGDYLIQSDWMAIEKTKRWWPAIVHGVTYTAPYALVTQSLPALLVIGLTHIVIDRYRLARYVVFVKNFLAPVKSWPVWRECRTTGYPSDRPEWLTVWLMIVADNTIHLLINTGAALWL
jgi:hypothetical protein